MGFPPRPTVLSIFAEIIFFYFIVCSFVWLLYTIFRVGVRTLRMGPYKEHLILMKACVVAEATFYLVTGFTVLVITDLIVTWSR